MKHEKCAACAVNGTEQYHTTPHAEDCERAKAWRAEQEAEERRYFERLNRGILTVTSADYD